MDYKTTKKLKEAGFPKEDIYLYPDTEETGNAPTLSEVIKECGYRFRWLKHNIHQKDKTFLAQAKNAKNAGKVKEIKCFGETPEEAMANLWIELNKKV